MVLEPVACPAKIAVHHVKAFTIDAGHTPASFRHAGDVVTDIAQRILMIRIHMVDDVGLRMGHGLGALMGNQQLVGIDVVNGTEPGNHMTVLDEQAIDPEIAELGIASGIGVAGQKTLQK